MIDVRISLQPKQKEFLHAVEKTPVVFFGGARGGGKSAGLRRIMLLRRLVYPGSTGAIFRRTYPELEGNHIRPLFQDYPFLREYWNESKKLITLPNGSTLQFCHCNGENDVALYQGREFHDLAIDEAGQWPETMFRTLLGSNRSSKPGIKARAILTGNPGGIGHAWLKRIFVERKFKEEERENDYTFIQAFVQDNAALLENDPDYVHRLKTEPNEALRRAFLYGDWDIFAGQFFSEISRTVHLIKPFNLPHHWSRFGAYDFGYNHPAAFGWFATDEDGNVYMYRELIKPQLRVDQFCQLLKSYPDTENLYPIVAGHDCWAKKGVLNESSPPTIAEEFAKHSIMLKRANIDRIQGAAQVRSYLAWQNKANGHNKPRFYIFDTCPITFDCLTRMQHDPNKVEDVLKVDAKEGDVYSGDDPFDMVRYALMTRPPITEHPPINYKYGSKEWAEQQVTEMEKAAQEHFESLQEQAGFV
jgi:phage terminase large subunit